MISLKPFLVSQKYKNLIANETGLYHDLPLRICHNYQVYIIFPVFLEVSHEDLLYLWAISSNNFIWNLKSRLIVANNLRHQFIRNSIAKWPKFNKSFYYNLQSFVLMNISSSSLKDAITSAPNSKYPRPHQGSPIRYSQKSLAFWTKSLLHLKEGLTCLFLYDKLRPCILSGFAHRGFQWSS